MMRQGSRGSNVDESLFGKTSSRSQTLAAAGSVISQAELARIRSSVVSSSSTNSHRDKARRAELAKTRKLDMQARDDARLKAKAESGQAAEEETAEIRAKLARSVPTHDVSKTVESYKSRAIALHGRLTQIEEKKRQKAAEARKVRIFHAQQKKLQRQAAEADRQRERQRAQQVARDAEALKAQIEENQYQKLLEQERVETEGILLRQQMAKAEDQERQLAEQKAVAARQRMMELQEANKAARQTRIARAKKERDMDRVAMRWLKEKAERERKAEEAEIRRREALEKETARLRAMQERAGDEKAERDAERAKRHMEEVELKRRADERAREEAARKRTQECMDEVARQLEFKEAKRRREKKIERGVMRKLAREGREAAAREAQEAAEARARAVQHGHELLDQIATKQARKREEVNAKYEERKQLLLERRIENELLEKMKRQAVADLAAMGIDQTWSRDIDAYPVENTKVT